MEKRLPLRAADIVNASSTRYFYLCQAAVKCLQGCAADNSGNYEYVMSCYLFNHNCQIFTSLRTKLNQESISELEQSLSMISSNGGTNLKNVND